MASRRATLKDVAQAVGVHPSTVSRALSPETEQLVKEEVRKRIARAASKLGFQMNSLAAGLRTRRSKSVGVVVPDLTNPVFPPILIGVEDALMEKGYISIVANSGNDPQRYRLVTDRLIGRQVDGLILASAIRQDPVVDHCVSSGVPLVLVNRKDESGRVSSVVNDDASGIWEAVKHLHDLGHSRIGHLAGPQNLSTGAARREAFGRAIRELGIRTTGADIVTCREFTREQGRLATRELIRKSGDLTAIVAGNDLLALGCYDALEELDLPCPRRVSVTGFNDMPLMDRVSPPLTTVRIRHHEMGLQAGRLLLQQVAGGATRLDVVLKPDLIIRGSTAAPAGSKSRRRSAA